MKTFGPYVAARTLREGAVELSRGLDLLTGIPVLLYVLSEVAPVPVLDHPRLLPYTDAGLEGERLFVAAALPPASEQASGGENVARQTLAALAWLHEGGLVHGCLTPDALWATAGGVSLAGAGLPWGDLGGGFDAPEGGKTPESDLYALGRTLQQLGALPEKLAHLTDPDPARRGTAHAALARLDEIDPAGVVGDLPSREDSTHENHAAPIAEPAPEAASPSPELPSEASLAEEPAAQVMTAQVVPVKEPPAAETVSVKEAQVPVAVTEGVPGQALAEVPDARGSVVVLRAAPSARPAPEPARPEPARSPAADYGESVFFEDEKVASERAAPDKTAPNPRYQPIRIGWEEDHSWRVVKAPPTARGGSPLSRLPAWAPYAAGGVLALALLAGILSSRGGDVAGGAPCCTVRFSVTGADNARARLSVVSAPKGSGLRAGAFLGEAPGDVRFPNVAGAYTVRVQVAGYQDGSRVIELPRTKQLEIQLPRQ